MPTFSAAVFDTTLKDHQQTKAKTFSCLYATPKEIPLPYSPYSSPPSPYILNHKARRPAPLLKGSSDDVEATTTSSTSSEDDVLGRPVWDSTPPQGNFWGKKSASHISNGDIGSADADNCLAQESYLLESVRTKANKDHVPEYFYDRGQSVSFTSNSGAENSHNLSSSGGEFYDARDGNSLHLFFLIFSSISVFYFRCEVAFLSYCVPFPELSTDSGTPSSVNNMEAELRLSLLMESEKRRQAEETLEEMQVHWRRLRQQLAHVGLFLPLDPTSTQYSMNIADELRCQIEFTRFVSDSLDIELAKAEVEMEMTSELEAKKFEITQLSNRLHYSETVNQEMSQRNQEAIGRRNKKSRIFFFIYIMLFNISQCLKLC